MDTLAVNMEPNITTITTNCFMFPCDRFCYSIYLINTLLIFIQYETKLYYLYHFMYLTCLPTCKAQIKQYGTKHHNYHNKLLYVSMWPLLYRHHKEILVQISCILLVCQHAKLKLNTNKNVTAPTCKFQSHFTSVVGLALKVNKSRPVQKYLFILLTLFLFFVFVSSHVSMYVWSCDFFWRH
jgi:hypothetical protein